ncbi:Ycf48-like protein [Amycolatopsis sp. CA-230715]|nr:Ycf48-like protein [Amycolatopsis sp. CA-230715]
MFSMRIGSRLLRAAAVVLGSATVLATMVVPAEAAGFAWTPTPTGSDARLRGLSAVSASVAWVSGSKGTILRTVDGGAHWAQVAPPGTAGLDFRDIEAFDAQHAVALSIGEGEASRVYRTADGGRTWAESFRNTDPKAFYDCVAFFDPWRGLVMGDPVDGKIQLLATVDGGRHWQPMPKRLLPDAQPNEAGFAASGQCLTTRGPFDAWIGTGGGATSRVLHSSNGGLTWRAATTPIASSASAGVFATGFTDPRHGLAIGGDYAAPSNPAPALAVTRDGGRTWKPTEDAPDGYRSGLAWRGRNTAIAVGPTGTDVSTDAGQHWRLVDTGSFDTVDCAHGACWAAGEKGRAARSA